MTIGRDHHFRAAGSLLGSSALALAAAAFPAIASAQTTPSETAAASPGGVEEIVVTAQRRAENAQSVPIAITSLSGKTLEDSGYQQLTDLQYVVPGVQYDPTNGAAFQIRGVGSTSFDFSNEKSVNVVVDDVVMDAQRDNGLIGLEDIKQVEVLFGPQGTLFGKNSTSGVISVTTNNPVLNKFSLKLNASYGERNDRIVNGTINLPLGQNAALRVSAFEQGQDGKGEYVTLHRNLGRVEEYGTRAKLLWEPASNLEVVLAGDYEHHVDTSIRVPVGGPAGTNPSGNTYAPSAAVTNAEIAAGVTPGPENASDAEGSIGGIKTENASVSLHVRYQLGRDTITSITAYRGTQYFNKTPADLLPLNLNAYIPYNTGDLNTRKFSEELHLASPTGGFVEYLLGGFYNRLSANQTQLQWGTLGLLPSAGPAYFPVSGAVDPQTGALLGNTADFNAHNQTFAAFGQLKFNFTPQFSLVFGGRYSHDGNDQTISYFNTPSAPITGTNAVFLTGLPIAPGVTYQVVGNAPAAGYRTGSLSGDKFTYRIAPEFKLNRDVMLYASYSTGYKPGGIAYVGNNYDPYHPETVKAWEVGVKSELLDHKLRLNADAYLENFTNFQATILTPVISGLAGTILAPAIGNAPGLRSRGIEGSFAFRPVRAFSLSGSVGYNEAWFTNYVATPNVLNADGSIKTPGTSYTGTALTNAPNWTASLAADYENAVLPKLLLKAHMDYAYRGALQTVTGSLEGGNLLAAPVVNANGTHTPNAAYSYVPAYSLVNARVSLRPTDRDLEIGVYVRNLFNQYFSTGWQVYGSLGLLHYTSPDAYRTVGVFLKAGF